MQTLNKQKFVLFSVATIFFLVGFVLNITSWHSAYDFNMDFVPDFQNHGSNAFTNFMNVVSNIFNPVLCAGYIILIYLFTSRKLYVLSFLIWFLVLSVVVSLLKEFFQQPRPYWINSKVAMLQWTCYTEYGCPSGHSALAIVLIDFLVRFASSKFNIRNKFKWLLYTVAVLLQLLVMMSRVYLGMHSLNQVLFGLMVGVYSFVPYYLYAEEWIFKKCLVNLNSQNTKQVITYMLISIVVISGVLNLITFAPNYSVDQSWIDQIQSVPKCNSTYKFQNSFYLKCYEDSALLLIIPIIFIAFKLMHHHSSLLKRIAYPVCSKKYLYNLLAILLFTIIPVIVFLNPYWKNIDLPNKKTMGFLLWFNNAMGFMLAMLFLIGLSTWVVKYLKLNEYQINDNYKRLSEQVESRESES